MLTSQIHQHVSDGQAVLERAKNLRHEKFTWFPLATKVTAFVKRCFETGLHQPTTLRKTSGLLFAVVVTPISICVGVVLGLVDIVTIVFRAIIYGIKKSHSFETFDSLPNCLSPTATVLADLQRKLLDDETNARRAVEDAEFEGRASDHACVRDTAVSSISGGGTQHTSAIGTEVVEQPAQNSQQVEIPQAVRFFGQEGLAQAVEEVKKGIRPFAFVELLSQENQRHLESLSFKEEAFAFIGTARGITYPSIDDMDPASLLSGQKAQSIVQELADALKAVGFKEFSSQKRLLGQPAWHVDENPLHFDEKKEILRMTFALQGPTTQFFYPNQEEYTRLSNTTYTLDLASSEKLESLVDSITESNQERIFSGSRYDVCIFHTNVIHRRPPVGYGTSSCLLTSIQTPERSPQTESIPFLYQRL